jgi:hypothetical protein
MVENKRMVDVFKASGDVALGMIGMFGRMASEMVDARRKDRLNDEVGDFWVYAAQAFEKGMDDARETAKLVKDDLRERLR